MSVLVDSGNMEITEYEEDAGDSDPEIDFLEDHHFDLSDGLLTEFPEGDPDTSRDIDLRHISRLLLEQAVYPAVPINFEYPCGSVTGWPQWVDYELSIEPTRDKLSKAGILHSVFASARCDINRDVESLRHLVRQWNPHTHTFFCAWGEFSPTLEDVDNITGLPVVGVMNPFNFELDKRLQEKLNILKEGASSQRSKRRFANWVKHFWGTIEGGKFIPGSGFDSGCRLEAMIALWLTKFVFIEFSSEYVEQRVFPLAVAITTGVKFPLAPLFLGHLYRLLDYIVKDEMESAGRRGITTLVSTTFLQVYVWERFHELDVKPLTRHLYLELYNNDKDGSRHARMQYVPPTLPLLCRWFKRKQDKTVFTPSMLDDVEGFTWQPYLQSSGFEAFSYSARRCKTPSGRVKLYLATTAGFIPSITEDKERLTYAAVVYSPDRVMRQFGRVQDIPSDPPLALYARVRGASKMEKECILDYCGHILDIPTSIWEVECYDVSESYARYWTGVLHRFRQQAREKLECDTACLLPMTSSRLASHASVLTYARKHNLSYIQRWSNGSEEIVGCSESPDPKSKGKAKLKSSKAVVSHDSGKRHDLKKRVKRFKPKVDFTKFMHRTGSGVKVVTPTVGKIHKGAAVTKKTVTTPQPNKQVDVSGSAVRRGTKRKVDLGACTHPRRSYNLRRRNSLTPCGPSVHIHLSDGECDDTGDSEGEHSNDSGAPAEDGSMSNDSQDVAQLVPRNLGETKTDEHQEQDSLGRNNDCVNDEVEHDISSNEFYGHVSDFGNDEAPTVDASLSELTRHIPRENADIAALIPPGAIVTAAMTPSFAITTMAPFSIAVVTAATTPSDTAATSKIKPSSETHEPENVPDNDKLPTTELNLPIGKFADGWTARMDEFMAKFDSRAECISGMDAIVPTLSGVFVGFQGMDIPLEFVEPLAKFTEHFCEGDVLSLVKKDYTSKKKRELIIDFGKLLFSMEVHQVQNEEAFLIWRDACRDFVQAGLDIDFMMGSLKEASRHYFGYMMRPEGSDDQIAKFYKLQEEILQTKEKLALLEGELNETRSSLGLDLCGNPESILESSWTNDSRVALYLYKKV